MNQNIKDNLHENKMNKGTDKSLIKQKEYSTPSIINIGQINKITLSGGEIAQRDSGTAWSVS